MDNKLNKSIELIIQFFKLKILMILSKLKIKKFKNVKANIFLSKMIIVSFYVTLIIILTFVPYTGYINLGIINFTILPIFITAAAAHIGISGASIIGLSIGIGSLLRAYAFGDVTGMFYFPDISILPRFLCGLIIGLIGFKIFKKERKLFLNILNFSLLGAATVLLNTFLVTAFIFLHEYIAPITWLNNRNFYFWIGLIWINFLIEITIVALIAISITKVIIFLYQNHQNTLKNLL